MTALLGPTGEPLTLDGEGAAYDPSNDRPMRGIEYGMPDPDSQGVLLNETDLPDSVVMDAVATYMEQANLFTDGGGLSYGSSAMNYQSWPQMQGNSMMARRGPFRPPWNTFEEIKLARDMADRDDDIAATIGSMVALAFQNPPQNAHPDEVTTALFDEIGDDMKLEQVLKDIYREYLIAGQCTTATIFTQNSFSFTPDGTDRQRTRGVVSPLLGVLPAEQIRVVDNDIFGTGTLAYYPEDAKIQMWLRERFNPGTSAARLAEMRRQDPISFALFTEPVQMPWDADDNYTSGQVVYKLNPRMCARLSMPKGAWKYPRPPLTRNFALLEAKRLLNIMDHALLAGGANFLVVAKKGSDERPALPAEVANLRDVIKRAAQTGVMVGDHRLNVEIITPDLSELLSPDKRRLLGKKLAMALLRIPEHVTENAGTQGMNADVEIMTAVIESDRRDIVGHIERTVYKETAKRNPLTFTSGAPDIWHPKIILQGTNYYTDYVLKARDRGDISRRAAVEAGGFNYKAQVAQRRREKASGDDRVMTPAQVPFSSPNAGPQDNPEGRPRGSSSGNGRNAPTDQPAQARPRQTIQRNAGETVKAIYDEDAARVVRVGDLTEAIMEEYADSLHVGRVSALERQAIDAGETTQRGPVVVVPLGVDDEYSELQAVRLDSDTSLIVATREYDGAKVTAALSFKSPRWDITHAEDQAVAWGFSPRLKEPPAEE